MGDPRSPASARGSPPLCPGPPGGGGGARVGSARMWRLRMWCLITIVIVRFDSNSLTNTSFIIR